MLLEFPCRSYGNLAVLNGPLRQVHRQLLGVHQSTYADFAIQCSSSVMVLHSNFLPERLGIAQYLQALMMASWGNMPKSQLMRKMRGV